MFPSVLFLRCNDAVHQALIVEHESMSSYSCNHVVKPLGKKCNDVYAMMERWKPAGENGKGETQERKEEECEQGNHVVKPLGRNVMMNMQH